MVGMLSVQRLNSQDSSANLLNESHLMATLYWLETLSVVVFMTGPKAKGLLPQTLVSSAAIFLELKVGSDTVD